MLSETDCCSVPVSTLEIEVSAPGPTDPVASRIVPLTVAVEICADATGAKAIPVASANGSYSMHRKRLDNLVLTICSDSLLRLRGIH